MSVTLESLNLLAATADPREWTTGFRGFLQSSYPDIDCVSIFWDHGYNMPDDVARQVDFLTANLMIDEPAAQHFSPRSTEEGAPADWHIEYMITLGRKHDPSLQKFSDPIVRTYKDDDHYVGTLLFWRRLDLPPISKETIIAIDRMAPLIRFLITDLIARRDAADVTERSFFEASARMKRDGRLTCQENKVATLLLGGFNYDAVSERLNISVNTTRKYIKAIFNKLETHSQIGLILKYLSPKCLTSSEMNNGAKQHSP